ncbi:hypothetical protein [Herbaspirillum rubrisubalbicans]|uniref:hypothetical protein n=1 Tax=Herbaspirillum rubrisubalbicans TaxID=80842 RepID=UPI0021AC9B32|nr:hypothetical protein [Herbaspirillum rubrisubalbicans]
MHPSRRNGVDHGHVVLALLACQPRQTRLEHVPHGEHEIGIVFPGGAAVRDIKEIGMGIDVLHIGRDQAGDGLIG